MRKVPGLGIVVVIVFAVIPVVASLQGKGRVGEALLLLPLAVNYRVRNPGCRHNCRQPAWCRRGGSYGTGNGGHLRGSGGGSPQAVGLGVTVGEEASLKHLVG